MTPPRLPVPGSDDNVWGDVLNEFLLEAHAPDGKIAAGAIDTDQLVDGAVTNDKIDMASLVADSTLTNTFGTDSGAKPVGKGELFLAADDFGAIGNGSADDTAAIQAAFQASADLGRTLILQGRYRCTGSLSAVPGMSIHLDKGARLIKAFSGSAIGNAFIRNAGANYGSKTSNIRISGPGQLGAENHTFTGQIIGLYGDDIHLSDFTIDTYSGGQAIVIAGDRNRLTGLTIRNSSVEIGTGAIRMVGGTDFIARGCHGESGDDVFQFAPIASSSSPIYDMSISRSAYIGCTGRSSLARLLVAIIVNKDGVGGMTCSVTDCAFIGCYGLATEKGIFVSNDDSTGAVRNITFTDCAVDLSGGEPGYQGILVRRDVATFPTVGPVDDISFRRVRISNPVGVNFSFQGVPSNVMFDGCDFGKPSDPSNAFGARGGDVDRLTIRNCTFRGTGATQGLYVGPDPATQVLIDNCTFYETGLTSGAIHLDTATSARVQNCTFFQIGEAISTARAVRVGTPSSKVLIQGNDMSDMTVGTKITDLAADTVIRDNLGYETQASGTATVGAAQTSVTVSHGLPSGRTPTARNVTLTPASTLGTATRFWVSSVTATNLVITVDAAPGGSGATFAWRIDTARL